MEEPMCTVELAAIDPTAPSAVINRSSDITNAGCAAATGSSAPPAVINRPLGPGSRTPVAVVNSARGD